jgi:hypothetical protein
VITGINASLATFTLNNLNPSTTYQFQLRSKCSSNPDEFSAYTSLLIFTTTPLRLSEPEHKLFVQAIPNPAYNDLRVSIHSINDAELNIRICDVLGRVMLSEQRAISTPDLNINYEIDNWQAGLYLVYVTQGDERSIIKVIKR